MAIRAIIYTKDGQKLEAIIQKFAADLSEKQTKFLAEKTKEKLLENIEETRERVEKPTGPHLRDAIEVEVVPNGHGVGNFETLNKKTPWWAWINYGKAFSGREIPPGTKNDGAIVGHFEPGIKGVFTKGQPKFPINPQKPIAAHNYIEKTLAFMYTFAKNIGVVK